MSPRSQKSAGRSKRSSQPAKKDTETQDENQEDHELQSIAANVVKFLLAANQAKLPITREKIQKALNKTQHYRAVMAIAKTNLDKIFGFDLRELDQGKYILINKVANVQGVLTLPEEERKQQSLLFLVLTHIFMCDNSCSMESILTFLENMGIVKKNDPRDHGYFGNVKHLISTEFIKKKYIDKMTEKGVAGTDGDIHTYRWGSRAYEDLHPRRIMEFMGLIYPLRPMDQWTTQFAHLRKIENLSKRRQTI